MLSDVCCEPRTIIQSRSEANPYLRTPPYYIALLYADCCSNISGKKGKTVRSAQLWQ